MVNNKGSFDLNLNLGGGFGDLFGGGSKSGGSVGAITGGMTKGFTTSLGKFFGKAGPIGIILNQSLEALKKILGFVSESSASLKGTLQIFGQATKIFFKPFGDFLSFLLRPMSVALLKFALNFNKKADEWFGKTQVEEKTEEDISKLTEERAKEFEAEKGRKPTPEEREALIGPVEELNILKKNIGDFNKDTDNFFSNFGEGYRVLVEDLKTFNIDSFLTDFIKGTFDIGVWLTNTILGTDDTETGKTAKQLLTDLLNSTFGSEEEQKEAKDRLQSTTDQWLKNLFGSETEEVAEESLSSKIKGWFSSLFGDQETIDAVSEDLESESKSFFGSIIDKAKSFFSSIKEGVGGFFSASGSIVDRRTTVTVGEREPEAIIPLSRLENITSGGVGGGLKIENITINNPVLSSNQDINNVVEQLFEILQEKMSRRSSFGR